MKVLLLLGSGAEPGVLERDLVEEVQRFVDDGGAARAAVNVRATGEEHDQLAEIDNVREASAMVELWDPSSLDRALAVGATAGAHLVAAFRVEEVVQKDYERTWGTGEVSPGVKLVCLIRRRPDLTPEAFSEHWRNGHGPLALERQPGFWRYVQNHLLERLTDNTLGVDGIGQIHYRTVDDVLNRTFDSPEGYRLITEDMQRFLGEPSDAVLLTREHLVEPRVGASTS
jgi:hypothetical protein